MGRIWRLRDVRTVLEGVWWLVLGLQVDFAQCDFVVVCSLWRNMILGTKLVLDQRRSHQRVLNKYRHNVALTHCVTHIMVMMVLLNRRKICNEYIVHKKLMIITIRFVCITIYAQIGEDSWRRNCLIDRFSSQTGNYASVCLRRACDAPATVTIIYVPLSPFPIYITGASVYTMPCQDGI